MPFNRDVNRISRLLLGACFLSIYEGDLHLNCSKPGPRGAPDRSNSVRVSVVCPFFASPSIACPAIACPSIACPSVRCCVSSRCVLRVSTLLCGALNKCFQMAHRLGRQGGASCLTVTVRECEVVRCGVEWFFARGRCIISMREVGNDR